MNETKTAYDFISNKEMLDFSIYSTKSKYYDDPNKLVIGKMKDETWGIVTEEFVGLRPKTYSFLENKSECKKTKGVNKMVVASISHNEYKNVLLNDTCIRLSMNRIQGKDNRTGTYEINEVSLTCFDDKIYIKNNGYDGLPLGYQS